MCKTLFRGKRTDNGEWVYGYYVHRRKRMGIFGQTVTDLDRESDWIISFRDGTPYEVDPETVGQYTGLPDKNGKKIFKGDIINISSVVATTIMELTAVVQRNLKTANYELKGYGYNPISLEGVQYWGKVIGNIYDNPELLEVQNDG